MGAYRMLEEWRVGLLGPVGCKPLSKTGGEGGSDPGGLHGGDGAECRAEADDRNPRQPGYQS